MAIKKNYKLAAPPARGTSGTLTMDADAVSSGLAFLESELEKLDPMLREPLTNTTYPRDIDIESGGGWVEATSAFNVQYGVTGGEADGVGGVQNAIRRIQADVSKDLYKVLPYEVSMSIKIQDQLRGAVTGRSIEQMYDDGIRLDYDKYMDINTYLGQSAYGTEGLVNNSMITPASVPATGTGGSTQWKDKTPEQILSDIGGVKICTDCFKHTIKALKDRTSLRHQSQFFILRIQLVIEGFKFIHKRGKNFFIHCAPAFLNIAFI
jgi:hypothetical protein